MFDLECTQCGKVIDKKVVENCMDCGKRLCKKCARSCSICSDSPFCVDCIDIHIGDHEMES